MRAPDVNWESYVASFPAYPRDIYCAAAVVLDDGKATVDFTGKVAPVALQPIDPKYTIEYTYLSNPLRHANRTVDFAFYQKKPMY